MKKPSKAPKRAKPKARGAKRGPGPASAAFPNLDADTLNELRRILESEGGRDPRFPFSGAPVDLFAEYLERWDESGVDDDTADQFAENLTEALSELRISANGGDRKAREQIQEIQTMLEEALEDRSLSSVGLISTGK